MISVELLFGAAVKATLILALAWAAASALRKSADARYLVWTAALAALLVIPMLSLAPSRWRPVVPASTELFTAADQDVAVVAPVSRRTPPVIPVLWLCGFALASMRIAAGHLRVRATIRRSEPAGQFDGIPVRHSREIDVAVSYGIWHPTIVVAAGGAEWTAERRRVVLLHELVHIRRRAALRSLMAHLATAAYWFHPLAWFALARFRKEQERACDDAVIRQGVEHTDYAAHLVGVARAMVDGREWPEAHAMARGQDFEERVRGLLDPARKSQGADSANAGHGAGSAGNSDPAAGGATRTGRPSGVFDWFGA